ncbi:hypothetical protein M8C21_018989 [Ambrosia artemisiifolia]|uniref:AP2/ERF domain-containing protein n=1 Tax=Ambrosia artemisiifolia TaxID=4212 RepID=A0AAD5C4X5_AMBAR|nr:hypothetical protein M8C21_018989 [Ambrosia artemisiifolia]
MWDLNGFPDRRGLELEHDERNYKGKRVGSMSNSSSSAVVMEEDSEDSVTRLNGSDLIGFLDQPVTRQFFPVEDCEVGPTTSGGVEGATSFPTAHWFGVKFCNQSSSAASEAVAGVSDTMIGNTATTATAAVVQPLKKSRRGPRSRSSQYRGVTFYRRTGRWESHIWDCGKQVYLGGFDTAHSAARAYDRAAIKFRGMEADINYNLEDYQEDLKQVK